MGFLLFVLLVVAAVAAYKFRVPLIAKLTGQSTGRINRQINKRRD